MGELKRKLGRALNLMWSMPLLVFLFVTGMLLSVTVEKRLLRREATPRNDEDGKGA